MVVVHERVGGCAPIVGMSAFTPRMVNEPRFDNSQDLARAAALRIANLVRYSWFPVVFAKILCSYHVGAFITVHVRGVVGANVAPFVFHFVDREIFVRFVDVRDRVSCDVVEGSVNVVRGLKDHVPLFDFVYRLIGGRVVVCRVLKEQVFRPTLGSPIFFGREAASRLF